MLDQTLNGLPAKPGVGYKPQHFSAIMVDPGPVGWLEVHAENYMTDGGPRPRLLDALAAVHPLSLHGVSMSLAGPPCRRAACSYSVALTTK